MRYLLLSALTLGLVSCQNYDDQFDALDAEIAALKAENTRLENMIKTKAEATEVLNMLNERSNAIIAYVETYADGVNGALENQSAYILSEIAELQSQIDSIEIPSTEGLLSDSDVSLLQEQLELLQEDLTSLTTNVTDLASEVASIEPTVVVTTAWSPVFDAQTENFTQTTTSTIEEIVIDTNERLISVYSSSPVSSTVTSTVAEVGRSNVSGISSDTLNDAVVEMTTTTTEYSFHVEDADEVAYEHTVTSTTSWTLNE